MTIYKWMQIGCTRSDIHINNENLRIGRVLDVTNEIKKNGRKVDAKVTIQLYVQLSPCGAVLLFIQVFVSLCVNTVPNDRSCNQLQHSGITFTLNMASLAVLRNRWLVHRRLVLAAV